MHYGTRLARLRLLPLLAVVLSLHLVGCRILTIEEDRLARERRSENFDAAAYVDAVWENGVVAYADDVAQPIGEVLAASRQDLEATGREFGRQAGLGSPWTFLVHGEGTVRSANDTSRAGSLTLELSGASPSEAVTLLTGPVVPGTSIRDALPSMQFNDFANQIAFAEVGNALTGRALEAVTPALDGLDVGARLRFLGAFSIASAGEAVTITPLRVEPVGSSTGGEAP